MKNAHPKAVSKLSSKIKHRYNGTTTTGHTYKSKLQKFMTLTRRGQISRGLWMFKNTMVMVQKLEEYI